MSRRIMTTENLEEDVRIENHLRLSFWKITLVRQKQKKC